MRWIILLAAAVCFAQSAPEKSAVSGRVVSAATGAPLKKASVWLEKFAPSRGVNNAPAVPSVITDGEGRFSIQGVDPGTYQLLARRGGYLDQGYGATAPDMVGPPLELAPGDTKRELLVKLTPQSLVYGKVVDEDNDAVRGAQVKVLRVSYAGGARHLADSGWAASQDDGSFVVGGLSPGRYYVSASVPNIDQPQGRERFVPTYFPSAADPADGSPIQVGAGDEIRDIGIRLRKTRVYRVRGRVAMPEHYVAPGGLELRLMPGNRGLRTQTDGTFEFDAVPSGVYTIETDRFVSGRVAVTVADADVDGVTLTAGVGPLIQGKITPGGSVRLSLVAPGGGAEARYDAVAEEGQFFFGGLLPRSYSLNVDGLPEGSYVKSVTFQGRPVIDWTLDLSSGTGGDLVIDVSPNAGEVAGKVEQPGAVVQIWPKAGDTARSIRADARGEFRFASLPPGDYDVLAWHDLDDDLAQYAPFRAAFAADAAEVHVGERGRERVEPKVIGHDAIAAQAARLK